MGPVFVEAGDAAPREPVSAEQLAQVAREQTALPRGRVRWNPSRTGDGATFVGLETWVWLEAAARQVEVTASVGSMSATVRSQLVGLEVSVPRVGGVGRERVRCAGVGVPWREGERTDCAVVFGRSSAGEPVKGGHTQPTTTMTVAALWEASWTSSGSGSGSRPLGRPQAVEHEVEVPVAEIQAVVVSD